MPMQSPGLRAVMSYYQSSAKVTSEGDVNVSDEALQGLGTTLHFLKTSLFGAITQLVRPTTPSGSDSATRTSNPPSSHPSRGVPHSASAAEARRAQLLLDDDDDPTPLGILDDLDDSLRADDDPYIPSKPARRKELRLTDLIPDVGYFIAGGLSGITSRTATAPLDRLKVYLIAQTSNANETIQAAKEGKPATATAQGARTLWSACKELWAAGGVRSLFAGESDPKIPTACVLAANDL